MTTYLTTVEISRTLGINRRLPLDWAKAGKVRSVTEWRSYRDVTLICLEDCEAALTADWRRPRAKAEPRPDRAHPVPADHPWINSQLLPGSRERAREPIAPEIADIVRRATIAQVWRLVRIRALERDGVARKDAVQAVFNG